MDEIFEMMDDSRRSSYEQTYIEELYIKFMEKEHVQESHLAEFKDKISGKEVLIIAPGKSSVEEKEKVISEANRIDIVTISVNFDYAEYDTDFIFFPNSFICCY